MWHMLRNALVAGVVVAGTGVSALAADAPSQRDRARFTDDKGHYRADWRAGINRPSGVDGRSGSDRETIGEWLARLDTDEDAPYALTGKRAGDREDRSRYTDPKGRYRPDWRAGINRPAPQSRE